MHGWIVFIKKNLRRAVRLGLVADCPQKAVQGIEPALIVNDEKDREAPRASRPHSLTFLGNLTVLGLTIFYRPLGSYEQVAVPSTLVVDQTIHLNADLLKCAFIWSGGRAGSGLENAGYWCRSKLAR